MTCHDSPWLLASLANSSDITIGHTCDIIIQLQPVLKLYNFAWGDAFAALTKRIRNAKVRYFSGNSVFPSPKSNKDKKRSSSKIEEFLSPKSSEDQKKKRYSPQFGTEFGRNLWELFALTGPSSVQPALKPG